MKEIIKEIRKLKDKNYSYVLDGSYDEVLIDWVSGEYPDKMNKENRIDAFERFSDNAGYDEYGGVTFTDGYQTAMKEVLRLLELK